MLAGEFMPFVMQRADLVGGASAAISYAISYPLDTDQWLIPGKALGAKINGQRLSVLAVGFRGASGSIIQSATIGGLACTVLSGPSISSGARYTKTAFLLAETGGLGSDSADIAINFNTGQGAEISIVYMIPYRICGSPVFLPYHRGYTTGSSVTSLTVPGHKIIKGGISIIMATISGESWGDVSGFSPSHPNIDVNNLDINTILRLMVGWRQPAADYDGNAVANFSTSSHQKTLHVISF